MSTADERQVLELRVLARAYRAAEAEGLPAEAVTHAGWHVGARVGAGTAGGKLLVFHDSGVEAECVFRPGRDTLFNIMSRGLRSPEEVRPISVWSVTPGISGTVLPDVARVQLIDGDGVAVDADIVAHTFAADIDVVPPFEELPESASIADKIDAVWAHGARARAAARRLQVRVRDAVGSVLYEGPLLVSY